MNQRRLLLAARLALAISVVQTVATYLLGLWNPDLHLLSVAGACSSIVLIPWLSSRHRLYSAWTPTTFSVVIGANLHSWAIILRYPDEATVGRIFLLSRDVDWLVSTSWVYLMGITLVTGSYLVSSRVVVQTSTTRRPSTAGLPSNANALPIAAALLGVATLSLALFVWQTGGLAGNSLSAKRTVLPGLSFDPNEFRTFGYLRFFNAGAVVATGMLLYTWREKVGQARYTAALMLCISLSAAYPFYASNRSDVIGVVLALLVIVWVADLRLPARTVLAIVALPLFLLGYATLARNSAGASADGAADAVVLGLLEPLMATQNYADLPKTAHIAAAVPDPLEYRNGSTYTAWLVAPVPRALWPGKPVIGTGPIIGREIYGNRISGVPPGLFGESYLNFGLPGVPLVAVLFGFIIAAADRWIISRIDDPGSVIMYAVGAYRIGEFALGQSAGEAVLNSVLGFVLAYPAMRLWLGSTRNRSAPLDKRIPLPT